MDQAVFHQAVGWVVVGERAGNAVDLFELVDLVVVEQRGSDRFGVADKTDAARPGFADLATAKRDPAVVVADNDRVAAGLIHQRILQRAVFRAVKKNRPPAIDRPIAAQQRLLRIHDRARGMAEGETLQGHKTHGGFLFALKFHKRAKPRGLDHRRPEIQPAGGIEIKRVGFPVEKPFARRVELLKNILHEPVFFMDHPIAVVLPPPLLGNLAVGVLAGDQPGEAAP